MSILGVPVQYLHLCSKSPPTTMLHVYYPQGVQNACCHGNSHSLHSKGSCYKTTVNTMETSVISCVTAILQCAHTQDDLEYRYLRLMVDICVGRSQKFYDWKMSILTGNTQGSPTLLYRGKEDFRDSILRTHI